MAKIDFNAASAGGYDVAVGNEYEIAPGKFGKLPAPTVKLQRVVETMASESDVTDLKVCRAILSDLPEFDDDDAIAGMASVAVTDFFTLLKQIEARLTQESLQ